MLIPKPPKYPSQLMQPSASLQFWPPRAGGFQIYSKTFSEQLIFQAQTCSATPPRHRQKQDAQHFQHRPGNLPATLPSDDLWLRPCSCPAPRQVSRSPLAKLRAAGTSELLPASALRCEDRECIVTIGTREARRNCGRDSASQLGKIHLGHVSNGIYNKGDNLYLRCAGRGLTLKCRSSTKLLFL